VYSYQLSVQFHILLPGVYPSYRLLNFAVRGPVEVGLTHYSATIKAALGAQGLRVYSLQFMLLL
jgi:hypothetical protein